MIAALLQRFDRSTDIAARRVIAHVVVSVLGAAVLTLLPWMVEILVDELGATAAQAGAVASLQLGGAALGYVIALFFGRAIGNARMSSGGALLSLAAFIGSLAVHSLMVTAVFWTVSGIGAGLAAASAYRSAAVESHPKFLFALMMTGQMLFGLVAFLLMPLLDPGKRWMVYAVLAAYCLLALLVSKQMRDENARIDGHSGTSGLHSGLGIAAFIMSGSLLLHFVANSMQWSFFDRLGVIAGIDAGTISRALALSMVGGLAGAALSSLRGLSERLVIVVGILMIVLSNLLLIGPNPTTYIAAALLMNFSVMWVQPTYLGFLARLANGTAAVTWGQLQTSIGLMVGPFVGGLLLGDLGVRAFVLGVVAFFLCALALALLAFTLGGAVNRRRGNP